MIANAPIDKNEIKASCRIVGYVETGRKPASKRFEPSAGRMVASLH
jgi:hypothetical protein